MENFYYFVITHHNGEKEEISGQLNRLDGPIAGAHEKFEKLKNQLYLELEVGWIKDVVYGFES